SSCSSSSPKTNFTRLRLALFVGGRSAKGNQFVAPVVLQLRADFKSILVVMKALYVRGHRRDMIAYANKATHDLISTPHRL
ncbi:hypothetical protein, partial [Burkholderia pseudomallei]|uniref:hypothetical protein n=1 Tax=Burkholderia pseudomallei TaxID=28450 RepID=UPI001C4C0891